MSTTLSRPLSLDQPNLWMGAAEPWGFSLIAGPCSAESEAQVLASALALRALGVRTLRLGLWKPRSRPYTFEGAGLEALPWVARVKQLTDLRIVAEVATPEQLEAALGAGLDGVWLGARTTVNPFVVEELAEALRGVHIPVLVKNPITPDLALWIGALERLNRVGITALAACHRGFAVHGAARYRNAPMWELPLELRRVLPTLPLIGDPSHVAGRRALVGEVAQRMLDLGYDGLIIESHPDPDQALSDAAQQLTPVALGELLHRLTPRRPDAPDAAYHHELEGLRARIDEVDHALLRTLAQRLSLVDQIGALKNEHDVQLFQGERWREVFRSRLDEAQALGLSAEFVEAALRLLHGESLRRQLPDSTD